MQLVEKLSGIGWNKCLETVVLTLKNFGAHSTTTAIRNAAGIETIIKTAGWTQSPLCLQNFIIFLSVIKIKIANCIL